jgi:cytochrome P450
MDPEFLQDPYPTFSKLRDEDPIHRSDLGFWVATRYDDCRSVLIDKSFGQGDFVRNIQLFYDDSFDVLAQPAYAWLSRVFVMQDPPQHTRVRDLVASALTHRRVKEMAPRIRQLAARQLQQVAKLEDVNFITDFAYLFPTLVMCDMLGMEEGEFSWELLAELNQAVADTFPVFETRALEPQELALANQQMNFLTEFFDDLFQRRKKAPRNDLTTAMVYAGDGEDALTQEELSTSVIGLFGAGFETTAHMIGNGIFCLGANLEQRVKLQNNIELADAAVEEILRFESSLQATYRTALEPKEVAGQKIGVGERVLTIVAAANRDERHFDNPESFDISPREQKPLTFGGGIHYCVGAALARLEGKIFLEELFTAYPNFSVDIESARLRGAFLFRGYEDLRVTLRA